MTYSRSYIPGRPDTDHNNVNRALREETDRMGGNPYREKMLLAIKKRDMNEKYLEKISDTLSLIFYLLCFITGILLAQSF